MDGEAAVPTGRIQRAARLTLIGADAAMGAMIGGDPSASAARVARNLAELRGLAAKMGQLAGYVEGLLPAAQRGAYEQTLRSLQDAAMASPAAEIQLTIEKELGAPIGELFDSWDPTPIASASLGQVHRADLRGRPVALKVQHPGIARATDQDLSNGAMLEKLAAMFLGRNFGTRAMYDELATGFREELDYELEGRRQMRIRRIHAADPAIRVPEVIEERTTRRVLCMELVGGATLEQARAAAPAEREAWCRTLWRFVFRGILAEGVFNADPHPGNYFFGPDGRVTFVDFGCTRQIAADKIGAIRAAHHAAQVRDEVAFEATVAEMMQTRPGPLQQLSARFVRECFVPLFASPFHVTSEYVEGLVTKAREFTEGMRALSAAEVTPSPPDLVFLNRLHFGFYSVLSRLDSEVDYAAIERALGAPVDATANVAG